LFVSIMMMTTMMMTATMVNGYAMLCTPKTRVQVAMETGVVSSDANAATLPPDEDCPYCQEGSVCGKSTMVDYNAWQYAADGSGKIEFQEQAVYVMGNEIVLESILFPNHRGFIQAAVCPNTKTPTKACFQQYPLVFVEDELYGAPRDIVYPQRAYIPPSGIGKTRALMLLLLLSCLFVVCFFFFPHTDSLGVLSIFRFASIIYNIISRCTVFRLRWFGPHDGYAHETSFSSSRSHVRRGVVAVPVRVQCRLSYARVDGLSVAIRLGTLRKGRKHLLWIVQCTANLYAMCRDFDIRRPLVDTLCIVESIHDATDIA